MTTSGVLDKEDQLRKLIYLTETWKTAIDNRKVVGVVFIDFQKAFDTVSHNILIYKLQAMGLSGDVLKWLTSYLKEGSNSL